MSLLWFRLWLVWITVHTIAIPATYFWVQGLFGLSVLLYPFSWLFGPHVLRFLCFAFGPAPTESEDGGFSVALDVGGMGGEDKGSLRRLSPLWQDAIRRSEAASVGDAGAGGFDTLVSTDVTGPDVPHGRDVPLPWQTWYRIWKIWTALVLFATAASFLVSNTLGFWMLVASPVLIYFARFVVRYLWAAP